MYDNLMVIGTLVLGAAMLISLVFLMYRQYHPSKTYKSTPGRSTRRDKGVSALASFARSNEFRFLSPAAIRSGEQTAQLDAIAVGYFGVLGVICLGYGGDVYGEAGDDEWLQVSKSGQRVHFPNPIKASSQAVRVVRDALFAQKQKKVPVEVAYVFCNDDAQLALPRSIGAMKLKDWKEYLKKEKFLEDTGLDLDAVENALKACLIPAEEAGNGEKTAKE